MVLAHVKSLLASQLREKVVNAVITVSADFSNSQRQASIDAASIARLRHFWYGRKTLKIVILSS
jgi:molecular chaperone DnaK (HSP70)